MSMRIPLSMEIESTALKDVFILTPARHSDTRGFFSESWNHKRMIDAGLNYQFVQDNHSLSEAVGTIRGLHYQSHPHAQTKLVRCGQGSLFDVAVDIRHGSPTYGKWVGVELTAQNGKQLLIPAGFLHGFATRTPNTEIIYKCTDYYAPDCDGAVRYDDPAIGINWGLGEHPPLLSQKDAAAPVLADIGTPSNFEE